MEKPKQNRLTAHGFYVDFLRNALCLKKISTDIVDSRVLIQDNGAFKLQIEAAVVQIDTADNSGIIGKNHFGMNKSRTVLEDPNAVFQ